MVSNAENTTPYEAYTMVKPEEEENEESAHDNSTPNELCIENDAEMECKIPPPNKMSETICQLSGETPKAFRIENIGTAGLSDYPLTPLRRENRHIICIPKVSNKISKQYMFGIFCALKIGFIEKLTEVPIKHDCTHKRVFIKIKWNQSELSQYICRRFDSGENVKVVYSEPWYWICMPNILTARSTTQRIRPAI
jgi:hypothetical protein